MVLAFGVDGRPATAQAPARLLVTVVDTDGAPIGGLTRANFTLLRDDAQVEILSVEPVPSTAQIVAIFEGLAATQRQLNRAIAQFIGGLDDASIVDMQSVDGELDAAIVEAVDDLHARHVARPVIVMLGQASEIAPSELQSSQVRGRRRAADLSGDLDRLARLLAAHGVLFYGISVTEVALPNFQALAAATGGRFERLTDPSRLGDTLAGIGRELGTQFLVSYAAGAGDETLPHLNVRGPGFTTRVRPFAPTH